MCGTFVFAVDIRFVSLLFALLRSQSRSRSYVRTYVASDCSFVLLLTRLTNISHWFKYIVSDLRNIYVISIHSLILVACYAGTYVVGSNQFFFCSFFWLLSTYVRMWLDLVIQSFGLTLLGIKIKIVRTYVRTYRSFKTNNNKKKKTTPTSTTWDDVADKFTPNGRTYRIKLQWASFFFYWFDHQSWSMILKRTKLIGALLVVLEDNISSRRIERH